jgi:SPP1 family predicted phage head-tail adaptor
MTETAAGAGSITTAWATLVNTWAQVDPVRGREYFDGQTVEAEEWFRLTIRYDADNTITEAMSFLANGDRYLFRSVANVGMRNRHLEIMAVRRA